MKQMKDHPVILFDGVCNLCNAIVLFVIRRDPEAKLKFASLQSEEGQALLQMYEFPLGQPLDTFILIEKEHLYIKSTAALRMVKYLAGWWRLLYAAIVIPRPIRDALYTFIARNRYKWFGSQSACMIPTPELKQRFL